MKIFSMNNPQGYTWSLTYPANSVDTFARFYKMSCNVCYPPIVLIAALAIYEIKLKLELSFGPSL
jgi:hypothetical protein